MVRCSCLTAIPAWLTTIAVKLFLTCACSYLPGLGSVNFTLERNKVPGGQRRFCACAPVGHGVAVPSLALRARGSLFRQRNDREEITVVAAVRNDGELW